MATTRTLDALLTRREREIRAAAVALGAGNGREVPAHPEPSVPNDVEQGYLAAIDCFQHGLQCAGWDCLDLADRLALAGLRGDE